MKSLAFAIACVTVAVCSFVLFIIERKKINIYRLMMVAVMTAMSIAGRIIFAALPGFKPVTAIVVMCGMYFGIDAGFLCGALTALVSNMYFGQGPWTPFQMLTWGLIGLCAAVLSNVLKRSRILLALYGIIAGVAYSLLMDVYTVIWTIGSWSWGVYFTMIAAAVPYTIIYAVSNVVFLLGISIPFAKKLERSTHRCYNFSSERTIDNA